MPTILLTIQLSIKTMETMSEEFYRTWLSFEGIDLAEITGPVHVGIVGPAAGTICKGYLPRSRLAR